MCQSVRKDVIDSNKRIVNKKNTREETKSLIFEKHYKACRNNTKSSPI